MALGAVRVKMLPFDNKSELQVLVDQDEGTPLEVTLETARRLRDHLVTLPEVKDVEVYAGTAAPFNFNGLVRHYFLRRAPPGADLQVNLVGKSERGCRATTSPRRSAPRCRRSAGPGRACPVIEIPPGPPVLDTLVAEIYGPTRGSASVARTVRGLFERTEGVVDVSDSLEAPRARTRLEVDGEKAGLQGASVGRGGDDRRTGRRPRRVPARGARPREPVPVRVRLSAADRASLGAASRCACRRRAGGGARRARPRRERARAPADRAQGPEAGRLRVRRPGGARESPVYALPALNEKIDALALPQGARVERHAIAPPLTSDRPALKWDGEWQITYEVFRDLGIAFAVVLVLIAILVIGWFQSFTAPIAILLPIPLSLIGILPGHFLFGAFFTATSIIGFIAGAGIIVRNSIILVDFIELKLRQGMALEEAVVEAGAVRFRPMLLTAAAVVVGSLVILFDPIFQGLAISLMMGEVAATLLSRIAVPVVYYLIARRGRAEALRQEGPSRALAA